MATINTGPITMIGVKRTVLPLYPKTFLYEFFPSCKGKLSVIYDCEIDLRKDITALSRVQGQLKYKHFSLSTQNGIAEHLFCTVKITDSVQIRRLISNLQLLVTWKQETVGLQRRVGKNECITQTKPWSTMIKLLRDHKVKDFNNETALYHQQLSHNYTSSLPLTLVHKAVSISSAKEVTSARSTDININSAWWRKKHQQPLVY